VVVKGWRRQGGCGDCGLEQEAAAAATMADARSLHAVRAALEDLEGHLHFLHVSILLSSLILDFLFTLYKNHLHLMILQM
jgi:hypothetical protein